MITVFVKRIHEKRNFSIQVLKHNQFLKIYRKTQKSLNPKLWKILVRNIMSSYSKAAMQYEMKLLTTPHRRKLFR